ncbi:MAG: amidase, partial [Planctomycetota bacterium]|nr:amidase [Planctomycetota bacterium]
MDITGSTTGQLLKAMQSGSVSAVDVTQAYLDEISADGETIGAFLTVNSEGALAVATEVDRKRSRGEPLGRLAGLPVAVKDNICTKGLATTCASRMLENFVPPYDAHVTTQLLNADAVIISKANLDEFAMGSSTENSALKVTRNPWNTDCTP